MARRARPPGDVHVEEGRGGWRRWGRWGRWRRERRRRLALGPARLTIPPGALSAPVTIQAQIPAGYSGNYIQFKPDKVVFNQPASLTISYSNCSLVNVTQLKVAQVSDVLQIIQYVPSTNDLDAHTVTGQLQHFSNYAVAW